MNDSTRNALVMWSKIMEGEDVSLSKNEDLYESYRFDSNVSNDMEEIMEIFGLDMYDNPTDGIFITPGVNNKFFGYSNDELKKMLKVKDLKELSICFFLMYCILTRFYKESSFLPLSEFVTVEQLFSDVENRINAIRIMRSESDESNDEDNSFDKLIDTWDKIADRKHVEGSTQKVHADGRSNKTKIGLIGKALKFFCDNDLLMYNERQDIYVVRPKMSTLVAYYYDEHKTRSEIVEYLDGLSEIPNVSLFNANEKIKDMNESDVNLKKPEQIQLSI